MLGTGIAAATLGTASADVLRNDDPQIYVFTKPLQELDMQQLAELLATWPVVGIEATIRKGGQIESKDAKEKLPRLYEALLARQRHQMILATDIDSADHPDVDAVLKTASKLGIRYFRMAYFKYQLDRPMVPQLESFAKQAKRLAEVASSLNMTGLYQNHAGVGYVGAAVWDLVEILQGIAPQHLAIAIDIRHTTIESTTAWVHAYERAKPHLGAVFVKDAVIERGQAKDVPLGQGFQAKSLFQRILKQGIPGPMSLHMEHLDHRDPMLLNKRIEATSKDISTLREWLSQKG